MSEQEIRTTENSPTYREWYDAQKFQKDMIVEFGTHLKENKEDLKLIAEDVKKLVIQVTTANGRTRKLEDWSNEAKTIIETNSKEVNSKINTLSKDYSINKAKIWTAISVLLIVGGAIITLSIMAIDSKIKNGIHEQFISNKNMIS